MSRKALLTTFFLYCGCAAPDASTSRLPADRIDDLIHRAGELRSFVARYHVRLEDGKETAIRLIYLAPDRARVTSSNEDESFTMSISSSTLEVRGQKAGEKPFAATVDRADRLLGRPDLLRHLLTASFPEALRTEDLPAAGGIGFDLFTGEGKEGESTLNCTVSFTGVEGTLFGWLTKLRDQTPTDTDSERFTYVLDGGYRCTLSMRSGFIEKIEKKTENGYDEGLELEGLALDMKIDESEFQVPVRDPEADDCSDTFRSNLMFMAQVVDRHNLCQALLSMEKEGRLEWGERARLEVAGVYRQLHAEYLKALYKSECELQKAWVDECAAWLSDALESVGSDDGEGWEKLARDVEEARKKVEAAQVEWCDAYISHSIESQEPDPESPLYSELLAMEKKIVPSVFDEIITRPILDAFDEKVLRLLKM